MLISLGISAAAVSLGLVRAAIVVQQERAGSPGDRRERGVPSPRGETAALIFIALVSALVVWFALSPSGSCDHLPYGSERTACGWEVAMGGLLLVWLATVAWVLASLVLGATWVVRTWNDIGRLRSSG